MAAPRHLTLIDVASGVQEPTRGGADYGEIFTRRWIVELILDLVGYTSDQDLALRTLVEPSCGTGAFLIPVIDRLIASCRSHGRDLASTAGCIRAFDVLEANAHRARKSAALRLEEAGIEARMAEELGGGWVTTGDFLLADHDPGLADHVVGNPPYIRLENVPPDITELYRDRCSTMRGRSDIYVGFIELGLRLLNPGGTLGFICADRWMRNQYGARLRSHIAKSYSVDVVLTMHDVDAFENEVSAYPAVVVLRNGEQGQAVVADASGKFDQLEAKKLTEWARRPSRRALALKAVEASRLERWFDSGDLWPAGTPAQLRLVAELESRFPSLEDTWTGTHVGIGVATGCDDIYLTRDAELVERDRLLPLLQAGDIVSGVPSWSGLYLINPWTDDGIVDLADYPRLRTYFDHHSARLRSRHTARSHPDQWYRTIDRVHRGLLKRPKLLFPDIKAASHPVLDHGLYYPHHNLYTVTSDRWDLEVLGGILLSDIANLFVGAYCVKMRGGCYRFQAQYLRRIRVPPIEALLPGRARALADAFSARDRDRATGVTAECFGLTRRALRTAGVRWDDRQVDSAQGRPGFVALN